MRVMNVDPVIMQQSAAASKHALEQAYIHIAAEIKGDIPPLMETLTPEGPYAYTIMPEVHPDGSVRLPILSTREEIHEAYKFIRGMSYLRSVTPLNEIRGEWYLFQDSISRGEMKSTGERGAHQTLGLFPSGRGTGITGELVWIRTPREALGARDHQGDGSKDETHVREEVFNLHERYLDALRLADVDAVLATLHDGVASAVRNYVDDTGRLTTLEGQDAHRAYYEALFDKYEFRSVEALDRIAETWYIFSEVRTTVSPRTGPDAGSERSFHRAEFYVPANDGRFIARIGHGTDVE